MNMLIHITNPFEAGNREPLMRLDIYRMMDELTQDWRHNAAHRDALALMTAIAMASLPGIEEHVPEGEGIRQGYLVRTPRNDSERSSRLKCDSSSENQISESLPSAPT